MPYPFLDISATPDQPTAFLFLPERVNIWTAHWQEYMSRGEGGVYCVAVLRVSSTYISHGPHLLSLDFVSSPPISRVPV